MARFDRCFAARDLFFETRDAGLQFMRGLRGNILAQLNLRRLFAGREIVEVHRHFLGVNGSERYCAVAHFRWQAGP